MHFDMMHNRYPDRGGAAYYCCCTGRIDWCFPLNAARRQKNLYRRAAITYNSFIKTCKNRPLTFSETECM